MEIKKFTVNGKEYEFVNSSRNTRSGFAHDTTLFINGVAKTKNTSHYLNRTWECYRYQTVMLGAVRELINDRRICLEKKYKEDNGFSKLTEKRRSVLEDIFTADNVLNEYEEAIKILQKY